MSYCISPINELCRLLHPQPWVPNFIKIYSNIWSLQQMETHKQINIFPFTLRSLPRSSMSDRSQAEGLWWTGEWGRSRCFLLWQHAFLYTTKHKARCGERVEVYHSLYRSPALHGERTASVLVLHRLHRVTFGCPAPLPFPSRPQHVAYGLCTYLVYLTATWLKSVLSGAPHVLNLVKRLNLGQCSLLLVGSESTSKRAQNPAANVQRTVCLRVWTLTHVMSSIRLKAEIVKLILGEWM